MTRAILAFLLILLPLVATADPGEKADALMLDWMERTRAAGAAVSVGVDGRIVWSEGYGYADLEQLVPLRPSVTRMRVGSVSKPFTAVALALLWEQGRLDLDAPVQTYAPGFPEKRWPVSTRQVAGHLAGIRHYEGDEFKSVEHYPTVESGLAIFAADSLVFRPGTRFGYSSYGWNLLSAVVEGASGEDFLAYMEERVFRPAGMLDTVADDIYAIVPGRGRYYEVRDGRPLPAPPVDNSYKWAGGGFLSTSEDLVRFGFAWMDGTLVQRSTADLFEAPQSTADGESTGYGMGWFSGFDRAGRPWVGHGGGSVGGATFFQIWPEQGLVLALITNSNAAPMGDLPQDIAELFLD